MNFFSNILFIMACKLDPDVIKKEPETMQLDCIKCKQHFVSAPNQEIKFGLCNSCFMDFDRQRKAGRLWVNDPAKIVQPSFYSENIQEWLSHEMG